MQDGKVLAVGGKEQPHSAEIWDPETGLWKTCLATLPVESAREYAMASLLPDGRVVVYVHVHICTYICTHIHIYMQPWRYFALLA